MSLTRMICAALLIQAVSTPVAAAPLRVGGYYEDVAAAACPSSPTCTVTFNPAPSDQYLMIRRVECQITSVFPARYVRLGSSSTIGGGNTRETFLSPNLYYISGATHITAIDQDLHYLVTRLRLPQVVAVVDQAVTSMNCKITGYLTRTVTTF